MKSSDLVVMRAISSRGVRGVRTTDSVVANAIRRFGKRITINAVLTAAQEAKYRKMGEEDFKKGVRLMPGASKSLTSAIGQEFDDRIGSPDGKKIRSAMKAWSDGWNKANLIAPISNSVVANAVRRFGSAVRVAKNEITEVAENDKWTAEDYRKRGFELGADQKWHKTGTKVETDGGEDKHKETEEDKNAQKSKSSEKGGDGPEVVEVTSKEEKKEETKDSKQPVDYGSKVQNTVNGIETRKNEKTFSMGIRTGNVDADIKECYKRASESQEEFSSAVDGAAKKLGMEVARFEDGHPVIGEGNVFFTRKDLKKEARVREKMEENDEETKRGGKPNDGINDIVDINGSTLVLGDGGDFREALSKLENCGMEVVRVKNCFENSAFEKTGYGDVKVNVKTSNGFVGEIIIADRYMAEQKMNGAGHGLYEITRSLTKALNFSDDDVVDGASGVRDAMNKLSRLVYLKKGEDHSTFETKRKDAVLACDRLSKIVNDERYRKLFDAKFSEQLPGIIEKIKDPKTFDGYRAELKRRGM